MLVTGNADSRIGHGEFEPGTPFIASDFADLNGDRTARGEFQGIRHQVGEHLLQAEGIRQIVLRRRAIPHGAHRQSLGVRTALEETLDVLQQLLRQPGPIVEFDAPRLDLRQIEQVIEDRQQAAARLEDDAAVIPAAGVGHFRTGQHLGHAEDAVERCANLVAHRREKLALGPVGRLGRLFGLHELGDIDPEADRRTIGGFPFAHIQPAAIRQLLDEIGLGLPVSGKAPLNPGLRVVYRLRILALGDTVADDLLEGRTRCESRPRNGVKQPILLVAPRQTIVRVIDREPLPDRFDRRMQHPLQVAALLVGLLLGRDIEVHPVHGERPARFAPVDDLAAQL